MNYLPSRYFPASLVLLFLTTFFLSNTSKNINQDNDQQKEEHICISLSQLINGVHSLPAFSTVPRGLDTLFGLSWLEGYILDPEYKDIILFGKADKSRRPYDFDEVLVSFQNIFSGSYQIPYCSLDPLPENMKKLTEVLQLKYDSYQAKLDAAALAVGGQQVVVGGVPRNTAYAETMINADYDMKKVSQGHAKVPGVRSIIEIISTMSSNQTSLSSRFWFHIKKSEAGILYPNFVNDRGTFKIAECPVVILTEKQQMDLEGNLSDNMEVDSVAEIFAAEFNKNFDKAVLIAPYFCRLENQYRLHSLFLLMETKNAIEECSFNRLRFFQHRYFLNQPLPKELPGLVNAALIENSNNTIFSIVAGGVSQEMEISDKNLTIVTTLNESRKIILESRPAGLPIYWTAKF